MERISIAIDTPTSFL